MKRRNFAFVALWMMLVVTATNSLGQQAKRPNIILIMADDVGVEGLGCYGGLEYATPRLDRLAAQGLRFEHAYSQPLCTNTRLQLMTGLHNNRNWTYFGILPPESKTIGHYAKSAGYRTCIAGKWQLQSYDPPDYPGAETRRGTGMHPKDAGFDRYSLFHSLHTEDKGSRYADPTYLQDGTLIGPVDGKYGPDMWVDYINEFVTTSSKQSDSDPFFVYYAMALPHWPMQPTPDSPEWKDPEKRTDTDTKYFGDMVEYMDQCVGRIVDRVDELGIAEDTLILFYSDNGTHLDITTETKSGPVAGGKAMPTDAGTHVPLIARWPGKIQTGVANDLVDSVDFLPTVMEAAGSPIPKSDGLDGVSFYQRLASETPSTRKWIYSFYDPRPGWDKDRFRLHVSARDRRWKLYNDGRLYNVPKDRLEASPILPADDTERTAKIRKRLSKVLESQGVAP